MLSPSVPLESQVSLEQRPWLLPSDFPVSAWAQFGMVSPILAIDPIIDMPRTMINVTGSLTNALVVDKMMGNLNLDDYNDMSLNTLDSKANKESAEK